MKVSRRLLLLFTGSVLLPGFTLAYLSFRSVKDENLVIEKSLETRHQSFLDAVSQLLIKTRQTHFENLQARLRQGASAETPQEAWSLASELLENPLVHSVAMFRGDTATFPRTLSDFQTSPVVENLYAHKASHASLISLVRQEWRARRYSPCLKAVRSLLYGSDSLPSIPDLISTRFGFRLMELKCLTDLGATQEAQTLAQRFVRDLTGTGTLDSYQEIGFYLNEAATLMTSLEDLPSEAREEFFTLHQRLPLFLSNAERVTREWPLQPAKILRIQPESSRDSLQVQYQEGIPFVRIGFPWTSRSTQILLRLDEKVFVEALRSELAPEGRSAWKDVDFSILNFRDEPVLENGGPMDRETALEQSFGDDFPGLRVIVYKKPASELLSLGRRRVALQYTLMAFSLLALLLGTLTLFGALNKEQRTVHMKSNFLSAVSHELKTPLTAIRMFAEILASGRQTQEEKRRQYVHRIGEEAERLQGMIEGILSYTRLEENPNALTFAELDLCAVAEETTALLSGAFAKAGIALATRMPDPTPLHADYNAMRSVVQNLLENALKYSKPHTEVVLEILNLPEEVFLRVADQGIGIPAGDLKHIFERFYRAGDELTRKTRGSGLGLALVKRIVDAHGGTIQVKSKVDEGTEMIIHFPKKGGSHAQDSRS